MQKEVGHRSAFVPPPFEGAIITSESWLLFNISLTWLFLIKGTSEGTINTLVQKLEHC